MIRPKVKSPWWTLHRRPQTSLRMSDCVDGRWTRTGDELMNSPNCDDILELSRTGLPIPNCLGCRVHSLFIGAMTWAWRFTRVCDVLVYAPPLSGPAFVRRLKYLRQTGIPAATVVSATAVVIETSPGTENGRKSVFSENNLDDYCCC